ncbi:glycine zipper 2TM domain-containing protein [soil metagenome]
MKANNVMAALAVAGTIAISGCAGTSDTRQVQSTAYPYQNASQAYSNSYGSIESIQIVQVDNGQTSSGSGVGAVAGGVVGGLLGNQIGAGNGRAAATVAGVVGGAVVGNEIEKNRRAGTREAYQLVVRLDNGNYQTVLQDSIVDLRVGDRVHVQDGRVYRY